jgi:hypothetical protein
MEQGLASYAAMGNNISSYYAGNVQKAKKKKRKKAGK